MGTAPGRKAWSKFFWGDWENDPALALCSMAAQGFWMRLLCIASREDGEVRIGGKRPTPDALATVTRQKVEDVETWIAELVTNGVCSLTQGRVIYSRRMREDRESYERNRENGLKGGNPKLKPSKGKQPVSAGQGVKAEAEAEAEAEADIEAKASPPAAPKREPRSASSKWETDADFVAAWSACTQTMRDRSDGRAKTWIAWKAAAVKAGSGSALLAALRRYVADDPDLNRPGSTAGRGFHRWLNDGKWERWLQAEQSPAAVVEYDPLPMRLRRWREDHYWDRDWGPRPLDEAA